MKPNKKLLMVLGLLATSTLVTVAQTDHSKNRQLWGSIATVPSSGAINYGDYTAANNKVLLTWRMLPEDTEDTAFNLWRKMGENGSWSCVNDYFKSGTKGIKGTNYQHDPIATVTGDIYSYDAICDGQGRPLFESSAHFPPSMMDVVNQRLDMSYEVLPAVPEQLRERGRATLKAFGVKNRFVHFEFFRLDRDRKGLGVKGDFVGLETNMRPAGGYTPDMMDYAHSTDVYTIWADMVTAGKRLLPESGDDHWCVYYGRRDGRDYVRSHEEICRLWGDKMVMTGRIPAAIAPDLGDAMYMVQIRSEAEKEAFLRDLSQTR